MDEASVVLTTGNRRYGHAFVGLQAMEVCQYSSDANFTVNLLCGYFGVDYYNIVEGPSNGMELLQFFDDVLDTLAMTCAFGTAEGFPISVF